MKLSQAERDWLPFLIPLIIGLVAYLFLGNHAHADDYQCVARDGCLAYESTPDGVKTHKFRKGDIIATGDGWALNPAAGWKKIGEPLAVPGDDYQCELEFCYATYTDASGTKKVKFRKGDIISSGGGWVVNPSKGWRKITAPEVPPFVCLVGLEVRP